MTEQDSAFILALMNDPAYIAGVRDNGLRTLEDARQYIREKVLPTYAERGFGPHLLELKEDGSAIGFCGLFRRKKYGVPDLGYALLPIARRRGYAFEAAQAMVEYARAALGLKALNGLVEPSNLASVRILEALGMRHQRTFTMEGYPGETAMYSVTFS